MSTAIAKIEPAPRLAVQDTAPMDFTGLVQMGDHLVRTGFLPQHIKNGSQVAAIVMTGRELGMTPMRALRSLVMVKGKVTESADSQLARFKSDGGRAEFKTLTETEAVLFLRHPNGDTHTESFTMKDAQAAGIVSDMYKKYAKAMLRSRAITAGLKSLGWEGGAGVYDPSELDAPAVEPAPLEIADVEVVPEPTITEKQAELLAKLATSHVFTEREAGKLLAVADKEKAKAAIDWATAEIKTRKAAEAEAEPADVEVAA